MTDLKTKEIVLSELAKVRDEMWEAAKRFRDEKTNPFHPYLEDWDKSKFNNMTEKIYKIAIVTTIMEEYYKNEKNGG